MKTVNFADKFHKLRQQQGITIRDIERQIGISRSTIVRWEHGRTIPNSPETMRILANFFHVPLAYFIEKDESTYLEETPVIQDLLKRIDRLEKICLKNGCP